MYCMIFSCKHLKLQHDGLAGKQKLLLFAVSCFIQLFKTTRDMYLEIFLGVGKEFSIEIKIIPKKLLLD